MRVGLLLLLMAGAASPQGFGGNSLEQRITVSKYPPALQVSSDRGFLPETADIGTTVRVSKEMHSESLQILVSDEDLKAGMPPATYQYILTGLGATIFAVDQRGFVYLNVNSIDGDPPNPSSYQLSIQAREVDTVPIRSSQPVTITIYIIDANDNSPVFEQPIYTANVSNTGDVQAVAKVVATDIDSGVFGEVHYSISEVVGGDASHFWYDDSTNTVMTRGELEAGKQYQVIVDAIDGGGRISKAYVIVYVLDPHTGRTSIRPLPGMETYTPHPTTSLPTPAYSGTDPHSLHTLSVVDEETIQTIVTEVTENTPPNTVVVSLGDDHSDVYFTIIGGNEEGKFRIKEETGTISTVGTFDREHTASYSLQVETRSRSVEQHLYWTLVQIAVLDVNDNTPSFVGTQPFKLVLEVRDVDEIHRNAIVGRVRVEDADGEDNGRISLGVTAPMDRLFTVTNNGVVSINGDFTAEHFGEHRLIIFARDHGDPPRESRAQVIVIIHPSAVSVATQPPMAPFVYTTTTATTTRMTTRRPSTVGTTTGTTQRPAVSSAMSTLPSAVLPKKQRVPPVFNPPQITVTVEENKSEREILQVVATYPDGETGPVTYELSKGDPALFAVNPYSGGVRLLRSLDAENEKSHQILITTREAKKSTLNSQLPHSCMVTVNVADTNDWIPNFESPSYSFSVLANTLPGTIIGQVVAFDEDRDPPNNEIMYTVASGQKEYFAISSDTGLITLARTVESLEGQEVTLRVEASDKGSPPQKAITTLHIMVEKADMQLIPEVVTMITRIPPDGHIQFVLRNYTTSVSEAVRPPHLVHVLPVIHKPFNSAFVSCNIVSGNYKGAFSVVAGTDGNCELRTQMELDRESVERYLLNVTVSAGSQTDFCLVSVSVLDTNDNMPHFIFDNDLSLTEFFAGVSADAPAFTRVLTVKAEDADLGNSSVVEYSLDPLSIHSKYFSITQNGDISTKQSIHQLAHINNKFQLRIMACDSPTSGQQLCSKADATVHVVKEKNRFRMHTSGLHPQQLRLHEQDIIRTLRQVTGRCTLLAVEKMVELPDGVDMRPKVDIFWYAVDPEEKEICTKEDIKRLFETTSIALVAGKLRPWFSLDQLTHESENIENVSDGIGQWKMATIFMLSLGVFIAAGAIVGICALCVFYSRYKRNAHAFPASYNQNKLGTIFLPNPPNVAGGDKIYETQMLELPISEEDITLNKDSACSTRERISYRNYGRPNSSYEGDFSIEESMYALNVAGRVDPVTKRLQTLVIPTPDYPTSQRM